VWCAGLDGTTRSPTYRDKYTRGRNDTIDSLDDDDDDDDDEHFVARNM